MHKIYIWKLHVSKLHLNQYFFLVFNYKWILLCFFSKHNKHTLSKNKTKIPQYYYTALLIAWKIY